MTPYDSRSVDAYATRVLLSLFTAPVTVLTPRMRSYSPRKLVKLVAYAPAHGLYESERAFCDLANEALTEGGDL